MQTHITARIPLKLKQAVLQDIKRRGIKNFSKYVEIALIHELNHKSNDALLYELTSLRDVIQEKIDEISEDEPEELFEECNIESHIKEIVEIQEIIGHVAPGVVETHAERCGVSFDEFLNRINEKGIEILIMN